MDTDGWTAVTLQKVRHEGGYTVGTHGRFEDAYEDERGVAVVRVERSTVETAVYGGELEWLRAGGEREPVAQQDKELILDRLQAGMANLGVTTRRY